MRARFTIMIAAIAGLWACEQDPMSDEESTGGRYANQTILIAPQADPQVEVESRGTPIISAQQMTNIGVFCAATGSSDWTAAAAPGKMFNTQLVRNTVSGKWEYSGAPVYWTATNGNDRYSFFAYAPYASGQNGINVQGGISTAGIPTITYATPKDVTKQPDLMLAVPRYNLRPSTSMVSLQMKHALTCVGFQIQGNGEKIKSLTIAGVYSSGTVQLNGENVVWSNLAQAASPINYSPLMNFDAGQNYTTALPTLSTNLIAGNGYLMLIPQTLNANTKLILTLSDNSTRELSLHTQVWAAGKKITYNIIITPEGIITLTPSICYISSLGVTHTTDNLALTCDPIDMEWTLGTNETWLRLTTNSNGSGASASIAGQGPMTIYTVADANPTLIERSAPLYIQGNTLKVVGTIVQLRYINPATIANGGNRPSAGPCYAGAFWRAAQTGERIIRIPMAASSDIGVWSASVVWMDDKWASDDIRFSTSTSLDTGISYTQDLTPADAEGYKVLDLKTIASGSVAANGTIYFRIGLKSTYTPTAAAPARYAVVALSFAGRGRTRLIYLRQGEEADYIMRPSDPATGSYSGARTLARKVSPFNLTQSALVSWSGGTLMTDHPLLLLRGGTFTEYPSQAGAYFQWASINQIRRAFHPATPTTTITGWSSLAPTTYWKEGIVGSLLSDIHELCPTGYKRMNDGSETTATTMQASTSELRQSLLLTLVDETGSSPTNASAGYYADGFFDRRQIKASPSGTAATVVSYYPGTTNPLNAKIAYAGAVVVNPTTNASIFFPAAGGRDPSNGTLLQTGTYGFYWTASSKATNSYASGFLPGSATSLLIGYEFTRATGASIRCVKVP